MHSTSIDGSSDETMRLLAEAASGFVKQDGKRIRALRASNVAYDPSTWRAIADQGWLSIVVDEADGGLGLGLAAAVVIAQRLGYCAWPEPFVGGGLMAPRLLASCANAALKSQHLAPLMAGDKVAAIAWQNEAGSLDPAQSGVVADGSDGAVTLSGAARLVPVANPDAFIVLAVGGPAPSLYWLDRNTPGLTVSSEPTPDGGSLARVRLEGVRVTGAELLLAGDAAMQAIAETIDLGLVATAAELVGLMERQIELTLEYLKTRKQFGQAIGSFQALQHRAVDIWMQKELARHAVNAAARTFDHSGVSASDRARAASGAKYRASDAAMLVAKQAIQLHGAIGYTDEYDLGLFVNRSLHLSSWLGNAADHKKRVAAYGTSKGSRAA